MLQITIPAQEYWDAAKEEFINTKECTLQLEHSLISLSKWESKWHKVFLSKEQKTHEETLDYIKCMTMNQNVNPNIFDRLTKENINDIKDYIGNPMSATYFSKELEGKSSREQITSELIYYWMIALNIPFECEKWHLNRLLTLVKICNIKNKPPKKMSKRQLANRNAALNAARKQQLNTTG